MTNRFVKWLACRFISFIGDGRFTLELTFLNEFVHITHWGDVTISSDRMYATTFTIRYAKGSHMVWLLALPPSRWPENLERLRIIMDDGKVLVARTCGHDEWVST